MVIELRQARRSGVGDRGGLVGFKYRRARRSAPRVRARPRRAGQRRAGARPAPRRRRTSSSATRCGAYVAAQRRGALRPRRIVPGGGERSNLFALAFCVARRLWCGAAPTLARIDEWRPRALRAARASRPSSSNCRISGRSRAASSCSPMTSRWAPAPSIRRPPCARSGPSRGRPPMSSPRAGRRDGRYGENPNRLQHYYQFQVILKPAPRGQPGALSRSLDALGIDAKRHDIRFVEDDWESPTLGAWGLGWEVWLDGMEVTQFTYFQQVGGIDCDPVSTELTYGLERLAMYVQGVENVYDLDFNGAGRELWRRVQARRARILRLQFRARRHRAAVPAFRRRREGMPRAPRAASCRCPPMTSASRRATPSTCSTRAA